MKGFPKVIKTKSDLVNTFKLVQKKRLKKEDWLAAVEKLENQNWMIYHRDKFESEAIRGWKHLIEQTEKENGDE